MSNLNGKKPLSSKPRPASISAGDVFGNPLSIPPELAAELKAKGLEGRWVNATKLYEFQGYHPKGWVPYKRTVSASDTMSFKTGNDPEGIIRRGDCILAVKTSEQAEQHRAFLKDRAERQDVNKIQRRHADDLRKAAAEAKVDLKIHEGYGKDEE